MLAIVMVATNSSNDPVLAITVLFPTTIICGSAIVPIESVMAKQYSLAYMNEVDEVDVAVGPPVISSCVITTDPIVPDCKGTVGNEVANVMVFDIC